MPTYLQYTDLYSLTNWSVQSAKKSDTIYSNKFSLARIGDFLNRSKEIILVEDNEIYNRITVKINNNGVVLRDTVKGSSIGTKKQYLAKGGQFIFSRIDARNAAFGIIPQNLNDAIVTNDFPLFNIDVDKINPQFLLLITTTKKFLKFVQSCSSGTTNRQRVDVEMLLNQKIPLPSMQEQGVIVSNYHSKILYSDSLIEKSNLLEDEKRKFLYSELGIENVDENIIRKKGSIHLITFSDLEKWGLDFVGKINTNRQKYREVPIKQICKISSGGTPSRNRRDFFEGGTIPWVKTGELNNKVLYDTEEKISDIALKNSSAKLYPKDSIVIAMYGATIGKTAKLGIEAATNQACAVLHNLDHSLVITDYLWEYLQTQTERLKNLAYGSAQPNLNAGIISNYQIPLPDINIQNFIVHKIKLMNKEKESLLINSSHLKEEAKKEFEISIFNHAI